MIARVHTLHKYYSLLSVIVLKAIIIIAYYIKANTANSNDMLTLDR